ncbi:MAG: hypothetical protein R6X02_35305 [Enhygromyxa sp.]
MRVHQLSHPTIDGADRSLADFATRGFAVLARFALTVTPEDPALIAAIEGALPG